MSLRLRLLKTYLRYVEKPWLEKVRDPLDARDNFEKSARRVFLNPPLAIFLPDLLKGVPALWAHARARREGVILFLHGGAYLMGSPRTHCALAARLAQMTGMRAVLPAYRLAPEHPFPAALEDALAAWQALLDRGYRARDIVLAGDSAGGGLMLALMSRLLQTGDRPAAGVAFSPWTDLTLSGASLAENAGRDVLLPVSRISEAREFYLSGADPADPGASPLLAEFSGAPPVFIQAARSEILRDDSLRMAAVLRAAGGRVCLDLWEDMPHVWSLFQGRLDEADVALERAAAFMDATLRGPRPADS